MVQQWDGNDSLLQSYSATVAAKEPPYDLLDIKIFKKTQLFHLVGPGQWRWPPFCQGNNWFEADNGKRESEARNAEVSASPLISLSVSAAGGKRVYLFCQITSSSSSPTIPIQTLQRCQKLQSLSCHSSSVQVTVLGFNHLDSIF